MLLSVGPSQTYATIGDALAVAANGDRIEVHAGTYPEDVDLFARTLELIGVDGSAVTTISGGSGSALVYIREGAPVISGFTLAPSGTRAMMVQAGAYSAAVTVSDVVFGPGEAPVGETGFYRMGTTLYVDTSTISLTDVVFLDGGAASPLAGGHIGVKSGQLVAERLVANGGVSAFGGAIYLEDTLASLTASSVAGGFANSAGAGTGLGGGIYLLDSQLELTDSAVTGCTAVAEGGGIHATGISALTMTGGGLADDTAGVGGGLICRDGATCDLDGVTIDSNLAHDAGGGFAAVDGTVNLVRSSVDRNHAAVGGGGAWRGGAGALTNDRLCENDATEWGGALSAEDGARVGTANDDFVSNTAQADGAAIGSSQSTFASLDDLFLGNTTFLGGGALARIDGPQVDTLAVRYALTFANGSDAAFTLDSSLLNVDPRLGSLIPGDCAGSGYVPDPGSPLIDGGDPTLTDPDGTRADIGLYGGPGAPTPPATAPDPADTGGEGLGTERAAAEIRREVVGCGCSGAPPSAFGLALVLVCARRRRA